MDLNISNEINDIKTSMINLQNLLHSNYSEKSNLSDGNTIMFDAAIKCITNAIYNLEQAEALYEVISNL